MKEFLLFALVAGLIGTGLPLPAEDSPGPRPPGSEDRVYALDFSGWTFTQDDFGPPMPILEAYAGETMHFIVYTTLGGHTFHLHGHPWEDPETGAMIDTANLLDVGDIHEFTQTAGLEEGHTGDWMYHCHVPGHSNMWGLLRVYPHSMSVDGPLDELVVTIHDKDNDPVERASLSVRWDEQALLDPTLDSADDGEPVPFEVEETAPGVYIVRTSMPRGATGGLVIESEYRTGHTLARLALHPDGSYSVNRNVGLDQLEANADVLSRIPDVLDGTG